MSNDCTLSYIRALTAPLITPPSTEELASILETPWNVRVPVDANDCSTRSHWKDQPQSPLFDKMMKWQDSGGGVKLHPYLSFSESIASPFFAPQDDIERCLKYLLLHQVGSHQTSSYSSLESYNTIVFVSTAPNFDAQELTNMQLSADCPLLRSHYDKSKQQVVFGYHDSKDVTKFHPLVHVSLTDEDWRLKLCILVTNTARILNCMIHYAIPLTCCPSKRCLIVENDISYIQKTYSSNDICGITTVENMISIYQSIQDVPFTDRLVSVNKQGDSTSCKFAPIGRTYLPQDTSELLDALECVAQALVMLHKQNIMHRDIRWANVFHALKDTTSFKRKWILFDFEFAAISPQPVLPTHSLTPGNHAPEMISDAQDGVHTAAVDIWGIGYLLANCYVDLSPELLQLQNDCMNSNPDQRPTAQECLARIQKLQSSKQKIEQTMECSKSICS